MARPWYPHYTADYERKTSHLTMLEDGAYRRMLDHYYATCKPLPLGAEHLYRICRAFADEERCAIDKVLKAFFVRKRDGYHNERADEEIAKTDGIVEKRRKAALSRYAKAPANAVQMDTQSQSQSQSQSQKEEDTPSLRSGVAHPRKAKTSIPDNFPDDDARRRAQEVWSKKGRPDLVASVLDEMTAFRDHHISNGKTSADWAASWRTWVKNAPGFTPQQRTYGNGTGRKESRIDATIRGIGKFIGEDSEAPRSDPARAAQPPTPISAHRSLPAPGDRTKDHEAAAGEPAWATRNNLPVTGTG